MDSNTRLLLLGAISLGSLLWGVKDLMRKQEESTLSLRVQSWAQVAAGLIGLGFVVSYLAAA
jgi:hypothetical protein